MTAGKDPRRCLACVRVREWAIATVGGALLVAVAWAIFFDTNNVRILSSEVRDVRGEPKSLFAAGETIQIYRVVCVDKIAPGIVVSEIINLDTKVVYPMGSRPSGAFAGCAPRTISIRLPPNIAPGRYEYRVVTHYDVNPLRTVVVTLPAIFFEVRAP